MIWESWNRNAEIRSDIVFSAPKVPQVFAVSNEREPWYPRCVETSGTYNNIHFVLYTLVICESFWRNLANRISEDVRVWRNEGFQIARSRCWSTTTRVEVLWYNLIHKALITLQLPFHLLEGEFACSVCFV